MPNPEILTPQRARTLRLQRKRKWPVKMNFLRGLPRKMNAAQSMRQRLRHG